MKNIEKNLREFYNNKGWHKNKLDDHYEDSVLWEDNREVSIDYVSKCRLRLAKLVENSCKLNNCNISLDVGCGPIQYSEYKKYYEAFKENHFLDISQKALDEASKVAKPNSKFICKSALEFKDENKYNAIIINHVLYHIDKNDQKEVIYNLINALKSNGKLYITYTNRYSIWNLIFYIPQLIFNLIKSKERRIYFYTYSINWWNQFHKNTNIKKYVLRSISSRESKLLIPNNNFGKKVLNFLFNLEKKFPNFFLFLGTYYIVEITKK